MTGEAYVPNFILTRELLDHHLIPSNYPGSNTQKFFVEGCPDVVVRLNEGETVESMRASYMAYQKLGEFGISLLDFAVVPHNNEAYIIAPKVHGLDLLEAIKAGAVPHKEVDDLWENVIAYLKNTYEEQQLVAEDTIGPEQYVYGWINGKEINKIYLVDLSENSGKWTVDTESYCSDLLLLCKSVVDCEEVSGEPLVSARKQLQAAIESVPDTDGYRCALSRMIEKVLLEKDLHLDFEDDFEEFVS